MGVPSRASGGAGDDVSKAASDTPSLTFSFPPKRTNSSIVFGGVSGRQVVVFSIMHHEEQAFHGANGAVDTNSAVVPMLIGQAAVYLTHKNIWSSGFEGKVVIKDTDEVRHCT